MIKREISEVAETRGMFGPKYVVTIDGRKKKFSKKEKAEAYRAKKIAELTAELEKERRELEKAERERERQAEEARLRAEYNNDPEYFTRWVSPARIKPKRSRSNMEANIDLQAYANKISDACYQLFRDGYEVISITPLNSAYASYTSGTETSIGGSPQGGWGAGWGLSYTKGVVLVGRKKPTALPLAGSENDSI